MDVHLRHLRYFVAVAEDLHFTRAAERLFVSQPALSKQIRQLERTLRVALLHRDRRNVSLTAAGHALLPRARELVSSWDDAQRATLTAGARAVLTVGVATSVGRGLLFQATRRVATNHPDARLQIRHVPWSDPTAGLADASSDVAILWLPVPSTAVDWEELVTEPRWVALPADHPLAAHEQLTFGDLLDETFLALPESAGALRDYWLALDHRDGHPPRIGGQVTSADETFDAIASGLGIALVAAGNADRYQREGTTARPVDGLTPARLAVAWRHDDTRALVVDFVAACRAAVTLAPDPSAAVASPEKITLSAAPTPAAGVRALRIATIDSVVPPQPAQLLNSFRARHPGTPVEISLGSTGQRLQRLRDGELDAAFVRLHTLSDDGLAFWPLWLDEMVVALPAQHPLTQHATLRLTDLESQALAFYPREQNPEFHDDIHARLRRAGVTLPTVREALEPERNLALVATGAAITLLSATLAALRETPGITYRPLQPPGLPIGLGLAWREPHSHKALQQFVQHAQDTATTITARSQPLNPSGPARAAS